MNQFSAQEPSLGYQYQIRYALYLLLKAKDNDNQIIRLENLDDVELVDGHHQELHQTKFHNNKTTKLTDSSVDFWKTIRIWSELVINDNLDPENTFFVLVTTSKISDKSIFQNLLENKERNVDKVLLRLDEISNSSKNNNLKKCFIEFNKLNNEQKKNIVKNIYIRDESKTHDELKISIKKELQLTFLPNHLDGAFTELEGYWYDKCISHLLGKIDSISYNEVRSVVNYISGKYQSESLPIDRIIFESNPNENYQERMFVKQLDFINIGENSINHAKKDYFRASEQRSKWIREELINPHEEIDYENKLKDDWTSKFSVLLDNVKEFDENLCKSHCKQFYNSYYALNYPNIYIRPRVNDIFLVKGSCHMLADKQHIVWHPNFIKNN